MNWRLLIAALLLLAPCAAVADAGKVLTGLGLIVSVFFPGAIYVAYGLMVAGAAYGAADARRQARRAQAKARDQYNASLTDRTATLVRATPPWRYIYGRCWVGGDIVAEITTDKQSINDRGAAATKPDALKHLVVELAHHEVQAIHGMRINGIDLGPVNASGWATGGPEDAPWGRVRRIVVSTAESVLFDAAGRYTVPEVSAGATLTQALAANVMPLNTLGYEADSGTVTGTPYTLTVDGNQLVGGPPGGRLYVSYEAEFVESSVRWSWHTGTDDQAADAYLLAVAPTLWTAQHRGRGRAYVVVTLDLEDPRFQSGPPQLHWDVSGRKALDPRTGATAWTDNPALCIYDWLRAPWGYAMAEGDIDTASVVAAANACQGAITLQQGEQVWPARPRYTLNGASHTAAAKEATLEEMANAMAGVAHYGAVWTLQAGVWTAPVMDLSDADLAGSIQIQQAGVGIEDAINSLRCTYIPAGSTTEGDGDDYTNAVFVAADGEELWGDASFAWTDHKARCRNLQRIRVEQARMGLVVQYPARLRAWPLQVGDRVRVTSSEYGWTAKHFRVTDWSFGLREAVLLTLQEDEESVWDLADAATADPAPNTDLANPWAVSQPTGLAASSGTAHLVRNSDGTITPRVRVTWDPPTSSHMSGGPARTDVEWAVLGDDTQPWSRAMAQGGETGVYITGVRDALWLAVRARHVNSLGIESAWVSVAHQVVGKRQPPADVTGIEIRVVPGALVLSWDACTDLDYAETEIRTGASWAAGTLLFVGRQDEWAWPWPQLGSYTLWLKHRDTTGNVSVSSASMVLTVTANEAQIGMDILWEDGGGADVTWDDGAGGDADWGTVSAVTYLVDTPQVAPEAITADQLASLAVTTAKLSTQAVTTDKLGDAAATTSKIAPGAATAVYRTFVAGPSIYNPAA